MRSMRCSIVLGDSSIACPISRNDMAAVKTAS
jgi:hypothetical protein